MLHWCLYCGVFDHYNWGDFLIPMLFTLSEKHKTEEFNLFLGTYEEIEELGKQGVDNGSHVTRMLVKVLFNMIQDWREWGLIEDDD